MTGAITYLGEGRLGLQTGGIEWHVDISEQSRKALAAEQSNQTGYAQTTQPDNVRIYIHMYHKEDSMRLYGFSNEHERELFLSLLKVSGIGPKQALKILSGFSTQELIKAIESEDVQTLSLVPGLGKKTAQKIILSLRGSLQMIPQEGTATISETPVEDIVSALIDMGFDRNKSRRVVSELINSTIEGEAETGIDEKRIFKDAIVRLSGDAG